MAEWSNAAVLKTVEGNTSRGSNPFLSAINKRKSKSPGFLIIAIKIGGSSSVGRALAFQAKGREFEPRLPLYGVLVQLVRIPACHAGGHGFESRTHRHNDINILKENNDDFVAQLVEHIPFKDGAMGSSPIGVTKHYSRILMVIWLLINVFFHSVIQVCFSS